MGWIITCVCLSIICIGLVAVMVNQTKTIDAQADVLKKKDASLDSCLHAWQKLTRLQNLRLVPHHDGATLVAEHDDPEMRRLGQEAMDELQSAFDEIEGFKTQHGG